MLLLEELSVHETYKGVQQVLWHANMMLNSRSAFSNVAVDLASVGSRMYGFSRYLQGLLSIKMMIAEQENAVRTLPQ